MEIKKLSKKQRRLNRQNQNDQNVKLNFKLKHIEPLTQNQKLVYTAFDQGKNLMLHGIAGTGKSFISLYLSLKEILNENSIYKKLYIIRSVVPTRDMGFLPGNSKEKSKVYEAPYHAICTELFERGDSYEYLKSRNIIEFDTTSFIRGFTFNDSIIIVDEMANCTLHELDSVITRIGKNCKIIFCGDFRQSDFTKDHEKNGLHDFIKIIRNMKYFTFVDFNANDIVRSNLVKEYIIQKDKLNIIA
jgi:phosphate starvation-inducible protein PhoH